MIFCTNLPPVVNITTCGKVGSLSQAVETDYVNQPRPVFPAPAVDNNCGQPCGECGKLWVFNRYSASFGTPAPVWKTWPSGLHNIGSGGRFSCYVTVPARADFRRTVRNCSDFPAICPSKKEAPRSSVLKFVEIPQAPASTRDFQKSSPSPVKTALPVPPDG